MRRFFLILSFIAVFTITSCEKTGTHFSLGFVSEYYQPDKIDFYFFYNNSIYIDIYGKSYQYSNGKSEEYLRLAEKYGDTRYKNKLVPGANPALSDEPSSITVVCESDIDAKHPSGTPLDDIILMLGWTYSEYVNSGYRTYAKEVSETYGYNIYSQSDHGHSPFFKYLKDIKKDDLKLMKTRFFLYLPKDWPAGDYNLTITMLFDDFELSETVTYTVE